MQVYEARNYIEFVSENLRKRQPTIPRGAIKALADRVRCHPTFISQVLRGKAHLSHEQALRFCVFAQLTEEEAEFFVDLLNRDRAGSPESKAHFERIVARKLRERTSLAKREHLSRSLSREQEILYFQSHLHSVVHSALHLREGMHPEFMAALLGLSKGQVLDSLLLLQSLGLAARDKSKWKPTEKNLHVGRDSPLNSNYHSMWRLKIASLLAENSRTSEHTHFSSVYCIARKDVERIRELILNGLQSARREMIASNSERIFALCLDFFPVGGGDQYAAIPAPR